MQKALATNISSQEASAVGERFGQLLEQYALLVREISQCAQDPELVVTLREDTSKHLADEPLTPHMLGSLTNFSECKATHKALPEEQSQAANQRETK